MKNHLLTTSNYIVSQDDTTVDTKNKLGGTSLVYFDVDPSKETSDNIVLFIEIFQGFKFYNSCESVKSYDEGIKKLESN